jgi:hypothetical protein
MSMVMSLFSIFMGAVALIFTIGALGELVRHRVTGAGPQPALSGMSRGDFVMLAIAVAPVIINGGVALANL